MSAAAAGRAGETERVADYRGQEWRVYRCSEGDNYDGWPGRDRVRAELGVRERKTGVERVSVKAKQAEDEGMCRASWRGRSGWMVGSGQRYTSTAV